MDWNIREYHRLRRAELLERAEQDRLARAVRKPSSRHTTRAWRRRVGGLLIAAGQALVGPPLCRAHDEARVIVDRSGL